METVHAARELGVPDDRICTIAAQVDGVSTANGANAAPGALEQVARLVAAGQLQVPVAATFPVEQIRRAAEPSGPALHANVHQPLVNRLKLTTESLDNSNLTTAAAGSRDWRGEARHN